MVRHSETFRRTKQFIVINTERPHVSSVCGVDRSYNMVRRTYSTLRYFTDRKVGLRYFTDRKVGFLLSVEHVLCSTVRYFTVRKVGHALLYKP